MISLRHQKVRERLTYFRSIIRRCSQSFGLVPSMRFSRVLTTTTRKLVDNSDVLDLARDLKLLRIPLEKYEIAEDKKSSDAKQAHIMPSEISSRLGEVAGDRCQIKEFLLVRAAGLIGEGRRSLGAFGRGA
jgi:hypothetical protein